MKLETIVRTRSILNEIMEDLWSGTLKQRCHASFGAAEAIAACETLIFEIDGQIKALAAEQLASTPGAGSARIPGVPRLELSRSTRRCAHMASPVAISEHAVSPTAFAPTQISGIGHTGRAAISSTVTFWAAMCGTQWQLIRHLKETGVAVPCA